MKQAPGLCNKPSQRPIINSPKQAQWPNPNCKTQHLPLPNLKDTFDSHCYVLNTTSTWKPLVVIINGHKVAQNPFPHKTHKVAQFYHWWNVKYSKHAVRAIIVYTILQYFKPWRKNKFSLWQQFTNSRIATENCKLGNTAMGYQSLFNGFCG